MAKAYQYDASGYFVGEVEDYGGPLPNNSTRTVPEVRNGYIPHWMGTAWEQVENHKGREGYMDGKPFTIKTYGPLPDGWSDTPPPPTLEEARAAKLAAIDAETSAAILAGFTYTIDAGNGPEPLHFSYDSFDQQNFADTANVAIMAQSGTKGLPTSVTWNAYRDWTPETGGELARLTLNPAEFLALYTEGAIAHKAAQMELGGQRKAAVEAASSIEEVEAI
jgi:hypothetical protein